MRFDIREAITAQVISALERGFVPWHKPWREFKHINAFTHKAYRGINPLLLALESEKRGFHDTRWATFLQVSKNGGCVSAGSKSVHVVFWNWIVKPDSDNEEETKRFPMLRYYSLFNVEQTNLVENGKLPSFSDYSHTIENATDEVAEGVYANMKNAPKVRLDTKAAYIPMLDEVIMPPMDSFDNSASYYATLWHELVHSTAHDTRVGRKSSFEKEGYAFEELVAELGAMFVASGINYDILVDNSISYIGEWLKALRDNKNYIIKASREAQKAADYILGENEKENINENEE